MIHDSARAAERTPNGSRSIALPHGSLRLPAFLPDATFGVVRTVDALDLQRCGVQAIQMNVFHLMQNPGSAVIRALGGLHQMAGWPLPITTDSGGFQAYSLIHQDPRRGSLTDKGITFRPEGSDRKLLLTPEKSIQLQFSYGADILICLDDCTHVDAPAADQNDAVRRTIAWGRRCKAEFARLLEQRGVDAARRPLILGVVQGGGDWRLREACATALLEIGFDGFGYGGWPLDSAGQLLAELLALTRELIPRELPMHALGVGHPVSIARCVDFGYEMFDSTLPTRDARRGRLYTFTADQPPAELAPHAEWFSFLYILDRKLIRDPRPIWPGCKCLCCEHFSRGYLHHLFRSKETLAMRLATIHNLHFMSDLVALLRRSPHGA